MSDQSQLSIIIVSWNTHDLLARCLKSIMAYPPAGCQFDVWVVDNASTDGSSEMVRRRFPEAKLITNSENIGFARANNQAMRACSGQTVVLLNSDTEVHDQTLSRLVEFLERVPRAAVVGGRLLNPDGSPQYYPSRSLTLGTLLMILWRLPGYRRFWRGALDSQEPCEVERVKGACMAVRRSAIDEVGLMAEDYFLYAEEDDWCLRFIRAGWKIYYLPQAVVTHYGGASTEQVSIEAAAHLYRSRVIYLKKHFSHLSARLYRAAVYITYWGKLVLCKLKPGCSGTVQKRIITLLQAIRQV